MCCQLHVDRLAHNSPRTQLETKLLILGALSQKSCSWPFPEVRATDQQPPPWLSCAFGWLIWWITGWERVWLARIVPGGLLGWFSLISASPVSQELSLFVKFTPSRQTFPPPRTILPPAAMAVATWQHEECWPPQAIPGSSHTSGAVRPSRPGQEEMSGCLMTRQGERWSAVHGSCHLNEIFLKCWTHLYL